MKDKIKQSRCPIFKKILLLNDNILHFVFVSQMLIVIIHTKYFLVADW